MTPLFGGLRLPFGDDGGRPAGDTDDVGADPVRLPFRDRDEAGALLGAAVAAHLAAEGAAPTAIVVLGVPRGGVVVAAAVARAVDAPLDVLVAHKVSGPWDPEFALGAVTADGTVVIEPWASREAGMDEQVLAQLAGLEVEAARAREARLRAGRAAVPVAGRVAVIVDDGLATGATVHAACIAARALGAARVVVAAPVASREAVDLLAPACDAVVTLAVPPGFGAVGRFYERFDQVADDTVIELLAAE
jgi:putative phosphoribosyl transferase